MLATVASLTSANRIKRRAYELGVFSSVIQTPQTLAREGCGYSLRFEDSSRKIIEGAASELGIKTRAFYYETIVDGKKKYIKTE